MPTQKYKLLPSPGLEIYIQQAGIHAEAQVVARARKTTSGLDMKDYSVL